MISMNFSCPIKCVGNLKIQKLKINIKMVFKKKREKMRDKKIFSEAVFEKQVADQAEIR